MSLQVRTLALEAIQALAPIASAIARHDRSLATQLRTAASSVVLNIAESEQSDPGNARARLHTAAGSARETRAALQLASAWGYVERERMLGADQLLDRVSAMLWRLLHSKRPSASR